MDLGIEGRVAIITGGGSGMGCTTAEFLLREGVKVVLTDRDRDQVTEAAQALSALGEVRPVAADLTTTKGTKQLHLFAAQAFEGAIPSILVHAAGVTGATGDFLELTDEDWLRTIQIDLMAAVRATRAFIPGMRAAKWGRVVLFASEDAVQPYADDLPYCAAKAGILNLAKGLSKAYGSDGVLVNTVSPAFIATPMTDAMMEKRAKKLGVSFEQAIDGFLATERLGIVSRRRGDVAEVAAAVAFLCSAKASFITGTNIRVDGGSIASVGS